AAQLAAWPAELLNALSAYALAYVASVAHVCASPRLAVWQLRLPSPVALGIAYGVIGLPAAAVYGRRRVRALRSPAPAAALAAAVLLVAALWLAGPRKHPPAPPRGFVATFLDVGQGDATLLQAPGDHAALVDGGPPDSGVVAKLTADGVRDLDLV